MFSFKYLFKLFCVVCAYSFGVAYSQSCPILLPHPDSTIPCTDIQNWNGLLNALNGGADYIIFCPFIIQKPTTKDSIDVTRALTAVCRTPGECVINTLPTEEKGILSIRNTAKLSIHGFVFQSSGTPFNKVSAVHILFATSAKQTFCNCAFKSIRGNARGTAIRSEPRTNVDVIDSVFEGNASYDIGSIFNRGIMTIQGCTFRRNSGQGGAMGSSRGSTTTLSNNLFTGNTGGVPLFFHDNDVVDNGGNSASNNDRCNGMYVQNGRKCITFQRPKDIITSSPVTEPRTDIPTNLDVIPGTKACERVATNKNLCISINSFTEFKERIENASGTLIFCPFTLNKHPLDTVLITTKISIVCNVLRGCRISGPNSQLRIEGESAQVFIQGFVFQGATITAVHIGSTARLAQSFCNCDFLDNQGQNRGVGLLAERYTEAEVSFCLFERNRSVDLGGSIFSRGIMKISNSIFRANLGRGGAIGNAPRALMILKSNSFVRNTGGIPIFFHDLSYTDLGGNLARGNSVCNGLWVDRGGTRGCVGFENLSNVAPTPIVPLVPILPAPETKTAPRGEGEGYFNYNINDNNYGPNGWGDVTDNPELKRYQELVGTLKRSLVNKCAWKKVNQSPIDLCENKINNDCDEYHQTRTHSGNINIDDPHVTAQILPSKLRLKYYNDRPPAVGPYPPEADFANNWNGFAEVNHIDIKIPSEHTICGVRYPAEYSIYMVHPMRRQTIVMSILLAFDKEDKTNTHLQKAIDEWQKVYDQNEMRCTGRPSERKLFSHVESQTTTSGRFEAFNFTSREARELKDETPFGRGGWDPFHRSLERTIYFWGYWGSLTEPPCSTFVAWRVLTEPAYISKAQWEQMKKVLFTNRDEECKYTSVNHKESVARPIQPGRARLLHKCTVSDYVSDREKQEIREKTGNPNWCC